MYAHACHICTAYIVERLRKNSSEKSHGLIYSIERWHGFSHPGSILHCVVLSNYFEKGSQTGSRQKLHYVLVISEAYHLLSDIH